MGGLSSKHVDESVSAPKAPTTPKIKQIPFDPRSPSDDISRTPITMLDAADSGADTTPTDAKIVKVVDPRSPNNEVARTPIIVEKKEVSRRPISLKPSALTKLESLTSSNDENNEGEEQDPRSPTTKVPRTPLEIKSQDLELGESYSDQKQGSDETNNVLPTKENKERQEQESTLVKRLFVSDGAVEKVRRPLVSVQNINGKTPKDILQAKHCRNVEDEYNKNHQTILNQLPEQEITVNSNTEFVENI